MKKIGSLVVLALVSSLAMANETTETNNLTLAAVDTSSTQAWEFKVAQPATKKIDETLEEKALELGNKINEQLEKSLSEKLSRELAF